ncbi:metallophosphoesterase family protein [Myroides sp. WP-1]|uniref:metallophosphoesterase family protein n=1 Tax=Myroides sp. WP-1 TaxID=2759944 RepID=UPI002106DDBB|nr:metallophosphoesterase family protein [Myroides sp. WP-1]
MKMSNRQKTGYFIVGDIHGCYYTFCQLLEQWDREKEILILVGDLIDRGNYSARVLRLCMELTEANECVVVLKGNHEAELIQYVVEGSNDNWTSQGGNLTLVDFEAHQLHPQMYISWLQALPLKYETSKIIVTHGGVTATADPFLEEHEDSVLWNRKPVVNIGKLQVHGHTPLHQMQAQYTPCSNSWNIDTGAYYGYGLTALRIDSETFTQTPITVETNPKDRRLEVR